MTKRCKAALIGLAILAAVVLANFYSSDLIGWWRGEAKYRGRYTNYWRAELRCYHVELGRDVLGHGYWDFVRTQSVWEQWLSKLLPISFQPKLDSPAPLQDGDPEAVPVLIELLQAPERTVRILAAHGLETIGSPARPAVPALLTLLKDENGDVVSQAILALIAIDPTTAKRIGLPEAWSLDW
jgi:hypothetical protein